MARKAVACTMKNRLANGQATITSYSWRDRIWGDPHVIDRRNAVEDAAVALVADGASPTQQHVTDLRDAWDALVDDLNAGIAGADAAIYYNSTTIVTKSTLRLAVEHLLAQLPETL